ncbi:Cysteine sulfinate desulfinase/cysteine desulfurase/related enzyme [Rubellimicrobium thermophilum DSM 16684]|uniref:Cysteine desulfurase n=1 Tax=Rubellimicrobium thermophilum DSM 16684 TaxID=1123069 RepID=S9R2K0_9RHOB|nr:aminotransferase class V-fold PLP-dependent enzyme [Rubellimicrobium thermophilum]EPX86198.1 Cysteine sulfinate desulfinase/cysteine desulfurase/related enzyme [Rubellimicrobium thermophilum DSM 16684]
MRVYLDWNATAPLRPEARAAMAEALDVVGNPSSVHAEGRAARALVERAREDLLEALGATQSDLVFTSGATEAAALALAGRGLKGAAVEHDAVAAWVETSLPVDRDGRVTVEDPAGSTLQLANSETGVVQTLPAGLAVSDVTQGIGRLPYAHDWAGVGMAILSAHKFGGPKGAGALILPRGHHPEPRAKGGGQEMGRRAGTENVPAIAGMAAAARAALRDLADGLWERVAQLRDILENALEAASPGTIFVGRGVARLPNTMLALTPGWKGETQVMAMDLAGFAVSSGSACSSGKVRASRTLRAMGFAEGDAACAMRVSLGPAVTEDEVLRLADAWSAALKKHKSRAA